MLTILPRIGQAGGTERAEGRGQIPSVTKCPRGTARAPPQKTVKRFRRDLRCDACSITMSTTMTPQAHVAALNALQLSIRMQANQLAGVLSTVKVPDDEAAKASLQGVLKSALRPPGAWSNLVDGAELEEHLGAVLESDEATKLLVEVLQAAVTADMKSQVEATKVKAMAALGEVAKKLMVN